MNREAIRSRIIVTLIYVALVALIVLPAVSSSATYDPQQAKGYPRLSDYQTLNHEENE